MILTQLAAKYSSVRDCQLFVYSLLIEQTMLLRASLFKIHFLFLGFELLPLIILFHRYWVQVELKLKVFPKPKVNLLSKARIYPVCVFNQMNNCL